MCQLVEDRSLLWVVLIYEVQFSHAALYVAIHSMHVDFFYNQSPCE